MGRFKCVNEGLDSVVVCGIGWNKFKYIYKGN